MKKVSRFYFIITISLKNDLFTKNDFTNGVNLLELKLKLEQKIKVNIQPFLNRESTVALRKKKLFIFSNSVVTDKALVLEKHQIYIYLCKTACRNRVKNPDNRYKSLCFCYRYKYADTVRSCSDIDLYTVKKTTTNN